MPETTSQPLLDPDVVAELHRLRGAGRENLFETFLAIFQSEMPGLIAAMHTAAAADNAGELASAAHSMKGAAACLGATRLSQLAGRLEALGRAGTVAGAESILAIVEPHIPEVCAAALRAEQEKSV